MLSEFMLIEWSLDSRDKAMDEVGSVISSLAEMKDSPFYTKKERAFLENKMNEINNVFFKR